MLPVVMWQPLIFVPCVCAIYVRMYFLSFPKEAQRKAKAERLAGQGKAPTNKQEITGGGGGGEGGGDDGGGRGGGGGEGSGKEVGGRRGGGTCFQYF